MNAQKVRGVRLLSESNATNRPAGVSSRLGPMSFLIRGKCRPSGEPSPSCTVMNGESQQRRIGKTVMAWVARLLTAPVSRPRRNDRYPSGPPRTNRHQADLHGHSDATGQDKLSGISCPRPSLGGCSSLAYPAHPVGAHRTSAASEPKPCLRNASWRPSQLNAAPPLALRLMDKI